MSAPKTDQTSTVSYWTLIRNNHNFRYLWFGQIVSLLGDWFNLIASATLISQLTQSGTAVGGLFVIRLLSQFLVSPFAGVIADRYDRKRILIITDVSRAVVVLGFLLVREPEQVWLLYGLTALQMAISGFFFPSRNAILPDVVSSAELGAANALSSATWSVMLAFGAALGGIVSGLFGVAAAFTIDSLTFILSAFLIAQIRVEIVPGLAGADKTIRAALRQYLEGLKYLKQHSDILVISLQKAANSLFITGGFQVIQVTLSERVYVIGEGGGVSLGLMFGVAGVGTGIGPIIARRFTGDRDRALRIGILCGYFIAGLGLLTAAPLFGFPLVLFGILLRGVGGGIIWVFSTQLLLQLLPNQVRGRVFATEFAFFTLLSAMGSGLAGQALDTSLTISQVMFWMAGLIVIPGTLWALWVILGKRKGLTTRVPMES